MGVEGWRWKLDGGLQGKKQIGGDVDGSVGCCPFTLIGLETYH